MLSVTSRPLKSSLGNLTSTDLANFARLKIPQELLVLAHVCRVTNFEARNDFGIAGNSDMDLGGIIFSYMNPSGTHRWSCRLRRDHSEVENGRPVRKYVAPFGDVHHLYFPPGSSRVLENPQAAIVLVEAEKSSLAITAWAMRTKVADQILAIATGGSWSWRGRKGKAVDPSGARVDEVGALADLSVCVGRTVYVLFDSNVATNEQVKKARRSLVRELQKLGAGVVRIVNLPVEPGINGPDDFLAAKGDEDFTALLLKPSTEDTPDQRPVITIHASKGFEAVDQVEEVLLNHAVDLKIFQRGGELVHIVALPEGRKEGGLKVRSGSVIIEPVSAVTLQEIFDRLVRFEKVDKEGNPHAVDCPARLCDIYLSRTGTRRVPVLNGTVFAPLIRDDGTILDSPGYDPSTRLYFISTETSWPSVPLEPTPDDVRKALDVLLKPFAEFPFCSSEDYSTHLAGIITAIQRRLLPTAPMIAYVAPERRTGKSKLAKGVSIIAIGRPAPATAASGDAEELRKAITAALYQGHPIVNLDNLEGALSSTSLARALTEQTYGDRILGETRMIELDTRVLWTCSGNNISFRGDLSVRVLQCSIDAKVERPEERTFKIKDLEKYLLEHRTELVSAALTILRGFFVAGRPPQDGIKPWGGFDVWSDTIRQALVWAGLADPAKTREKIAESDHEREDAITLLHALRDAFTEDSFTVRAILELADPPKEFGRYVVSPNLDLSDAVKAVAGRKGGIDRRSLGWWCRRWQDRIVDNLQLIKVGASCGSGKWRIEFLVSETGTEEQQ